MNKLHSHPWLPAGALALAGCAGAKPTPVATTTPATTVAAAPADPAGVGLDMADLDRTVNPCDDFFQFSGGNWLKNNPVPNYASSWGPRNLLGNRTQETLRRILEDAAANRTAAPGSNAQKVGDFYAAAMDTMAIQKAGIGQLKPELDRLAAVRDKAALRAAIRTIRP
ncbi:hypothetical protein [Hymenobacter glacialis]|uniref:Peptidase M13 N-terminal domain-containing protein n=1 Tax=Hymenobacter glacialis TaxID=1908236 RepID=A0A1G1T427_9BACT|nr:hypothetical protein [Hymenobacter glacialis]OGX85617.1 hypothetical protein BEN48_01940 [Hymenobacter glacialis]